MSKLDAAEPNTPRTTTIMLATFTSVDFWTCGIPHAFRVTIAALDWPAIVSSGVH